MWQTDKQTYRQTNTTQIYLRYGINFNRDIPDVQNGILTLAVEKFILQTRRFQNLCYPWPLNPPSLSPSCGCTFYQQFKTDCFRPVIILFYKWNILLYGHISTQNKFEYDFFILFRLGLSNKHNCFQSKLFW